MSTVDTQSYLIQRGGRLLLLSSDGKRLERLLITTLLPPLPGLWSATRTGDRVFLVDGGSDNAVYLSNGIRVCVVDVASGHQRLLFQDGVIRDHLGRPVTEIEGAAGAGMSDWQLLSVRLLTGDRVLHITVNHPLFGSAVCAIDARTGAAVVTQSGTWRRMATATFMDEQAGVVASVERDAFDVPIVVTSRELTARLVVGVPSGAVGKFSEVAVSPDGKSIAAVLAGSAMYVIDVGRRTSRRVSSGSYSVPKWNADCKTVTARKQGVLEQKSALIELNPETLRERLIIQNVDDYKVIYRKSPDWKIKSTP
jgi:hypothetical protein